MRSLTFIEIDVPTFIEESPAATETFRFTYDCGYQPEDIEAIPSIEAVSYSPAIISLGSNLGVRASLSVSFSDHRHIFNGEAFDSGTFWGKWRARYGQKLQGMPLRWIVGLEGQTLEQMETRHFIVEATEGPTLKGGYSVTAKDILKLADGDRAQAPLPSNGFTVADLSTVATSVTLSPAGIGNSEYPASGYVAIGGEEIVSFTRTNDVLTITRAQLGTEAVEHDAGSRVQIVLEYFGEDPANILYDLLTTYAGVDPDYIPLTSWQNETDAYLQQNYTTYIAEPTSVNKLISELIEQAALAMWWEPLTQLIRLQVLRPIPTTAATFDPDNTVEGSLGIKEQPSTRITQVFVYYGQKTPLLPLDQANSFRSTTLSVDEEAEAEYRLPVIKKIYSRWIPFGARSVAERLGTLLLGRFSDPPRRFTMAQFRYGEITPELGGGYQLEAWPLQTVTGADDAVPIQITRLNPTADRYDIEAEEMLFAQLDPADLINRTIIIDAAINNVNLRTLHDSIYPDPDAGASPAESLTCIIEQNVIVGSTSVSLPAFDIGSWPVGYPVTVRVFGRIQGKGGNGGDGSRDSTGEEAEPGQDGGTALYTRFAIDLTIEEGGGVWGGGGGGGGLTTRNDDDQIVDGYGGGGGAGQIPGTAGFSQPADENTTAPEDGTTEQGGQGADFSPFFFAGSGGDPGEPGVDILKAEDPGDAGSSIDGVSFCVISDTSPSGILGPQVN